MASDLVELFERLEWCRSEIDTVKGDYGSFVSTQPYTVYERPLYGLSKPRKLVLAKGTATLPKPIAIRVGTTTNELRSILDGLASALAVRNRRSTNGVYFPVAKSEAHFDTDDGISEKIRKLTPADRALIRSLKPWPTGNDLLCALHQADITRKHSRLILLANISGGIGIRAGNINGVIFPKPQRDLADEVVIAEVTMDSLFDFDLTPLMSFAEPPFLTGKDVIAVMGDFAREVESALKVFD